jgi:hypothetical protein
MKYLDRTYEVWKKDNEQMMVEETSENEELVVAGGKNANS